ncbi:hypothetical protein HRW16_16190 [Streptomyces lunaelactis]|nr:hypothetical protein [Streptomyces lunaelactis]
MATRGPGGSRAGAEGWSPPLLGGSWDADVFPADTFTADTFTAAAVR